MIPEFSESAINVLTAYGIATVLIAALVVHTLIKAGRSKRWLREAENYESD